MNSENLTPESPANLEDGEQLEAAPAAESKTQETTDSDVDASASGLPTPVEPYSIEVPAFLPMKAMDEQRTEMVAGFEVAAAESGIKATGAQTLVDAFADIATAIQYRVEHGYTTPEGAADEMEKAFGPEQAQTLIRDAQRYYAKLAKPMQDWLDYTGLGNDVGVLTTLALGQQGLFTLTPEKAQTQIDQIMKSKAFFSDDPKVRLIEVAKVQILSRLANREEKQPAKPVQVAQKLAAARSELNRELTELAKKREMSPEDRTRFMTLTARL